MFDDPRKELEALENRLLAEGEVPRDGMLDEAEFEMLYNEILEEFGPRDPEPPVRNFANNYGAKAAPHCPPPVAEEPKVRGNGCLVLTIVLEILAIAALAAFWGLSLLGG